MDDITVSEKTITVTFWDHGQEDGDMIDIVINGKTAFAGITLTNAHQSRTITLNSDIIVVGFKALNVGSVAPNTATVSFSSVTGGKETQKYTLTKNQEANMNVNYKPVISLIQRHRGRICFDKAQRLGCQHHHRLLIGAESLLFGRI